MSQFKKALVLIVNANTDASSALLDAVRLVLGMHSETFVFDCHTGLCCPPSFCTPSKSQSVLSVKRWLLLLCLRGIVQQSSLKLDVFFGGFDRDFHRLSLFHPLDHSSSDFFDRPDPFRRVCAHGNV